MDGFLILLLLIGIVFALFLAEVGAYGWHRWGTHSDLIPVLSKYVHNIHRQHHRAPLYDSTTASQDFLLVLVLGALLFIVLFLAYYYEYIPFWLAIFVLLIFIIALTWNWYVHSAYHSKDSWLERFEWFQQDRKTHFVHHTNPRKNYGIASFWVDTILGTFESRYDRELRSI